MSWQPIETAPTDGTVVDLWANDERLPDCKWKDENLYGWQQKYQETSDVFFWLGSPPDFNPTHWMLPPKPPVTEISMREYEPTEAQISAALDAANYFDSPHTRKNMRAALLAASGIIPPGQKWKWPNGIPGVTHAGPSDEVTVLLRIWQSCLGASREQCDETGKKLWDRIEAALKPV